MEHEWQGSANRREELRVVPIQSLPCGVNQGFPAASGLRHFSSDDLQDRCAEARAVIAAPRRGAAQGH